MPRPRQSRLLASVVVLLLVAAAGCGSQDVSSPAPLAEPIPPVESNAPEASEGTVASPTPAPEPAEAVDTTPTTSQPAEAPAPAEASTPAEPDAPGEAGGTGMGLEGLEGRWEGEISIPGPTGLPFAVDMTASGGGLRATIDIQGVSGLPLSNVVFDAGRIHFELNSPIGLAVWDGEVRDGVIEGDFTQAGMAETFWMQRFEDPASGDGEGAAFRREEVVFSNGDVVLTGELTLPEGDGPHPAVVLISGSGDQDRDSDIAGFRLFAVLADHLAGAGVASLRFDDRGVGGSTGDGLQATLQVRAADVEAAVDVLRSRDGIDAGRIGLVGHSEGGIVAPVVANRTEGVAFVVLLAAPAVLGAEILAAQQAQLFEESGATAEEAEQFRALLDLVFHAVATGQGWDDAEAAMRSVVQQGFEALPEQAREAIPDEDGLVDSIVAEEMAAWQSPWFGSFLEHDPRPAIVALDVPVIALYGELDVQVPAAVNSIAMSEAIAESNVPTHTIATIFSANHLFQEAVTGSVDEYRRLKREFVPDFVAILTEWLTDVIGT